MTKFTGQILDRSAKVKVKFLPTHRGGIPVEGLGILDTGANVSTIDAKSAGVGKFRHVGTDKVNTASQRNLPREVWEADLELLDFPGQKFPIQPSRRPSLK